MRLVIENGKNFTQVNFFMMIKELKPQHFTSQTSPFFKILTEELKIEQRYLDDFISTLGDRDDDSKDTLKLKTALQKSFYGLNETTDSSQLIDGERTSTYKKK